jgi:hypothetical protein
VLNHVCLRLISDPEKLSTAELRFFLRLLADFDLSRYRALHMQRLLENYAPITVELISNSINKLTSLGILEEGPQGKIRGRPQKLNTYRIRPAYLVSPQSMLDWFREGREREEREALLGTDWRGPAPPVV